MVANSLSNPSPDDSLSASAHTLTRADLADAVYRAVGLSRAESAAMVETVTRTEIDVDGARPVIATPDRQARTIAVSSFAGPLATVSIRAAEQPVTALARRSDGPMLRCWGAGSMSDLAAVLDAPARIWVGVPPQELSRTLLLQAGWVVAVAGMARLVLARATRHLQIAGG